MRPGAAVLVLCAFAFAFANACAPTDRHVVLGQLRGELANQFHECVPLGWSVDVTHGVALPGASSEVNEQGNGRVWLPAMWMAHIRARDRRRADIRTTEQLLDRLTQARLLRRDDGAFGKVYHLTAAALPYYFAENVRGNDPAGLSYLCYSTVVPDAVQWTQPVRTERFDNDDRRVFRAGFTWHAGEVAPWARDDFIRAHGVRLTPTHSPAVAKFVRSGDGWALSALYASEPPLPRVVDASAWP